MACVGDISVRLEMALSSNFQYRIPEITYIIDTSPMKDLQSIFPRLIDHIFGIGGTPGGWGLRTTTTTLQFELIHNFLSPLGPFFRLCYRLLGDHQFKYSFPLHLLPIDIYQTLESGRFPQYYADQLIIDPQTMHIISLYLNPFDFYIFHFAAHVHSLFPNTGSWESWNTVYFTLACDYLLHFLPSDPNKIVIPEIPFYTGKAPAVNSLQSSIRPSHQPFSLLNHDLIGLDHEDNPSQANPRNAVWRSETIQQIFIDFWLSTSDLLEMPQGSATQTPNSIGGCGAWTERVRIARALVKAVHAWSNVGAVGLPGSPAASENELLRRSARKALKIRAYNLIRVLAERWPLDASFRLPLEFWLSFLQPWRYSGEQVERQDHSSSGPDLPRLKWRSHAKAHCFQVSEQIRSLALPSPSFRTDEGSKAVKFLDQSYKPFIAENLPAYTYIFQLVAPRFMRLDLSFPKNAIMLYRLTKVFVQSNLISILQDMEKNLMQSNTDEIGRTGLPTDSMQNFFSIYNYPSSPYWLNHPNQIYGEIMESVAEYAPLWTQEWQNNAGKLALRILAAKNHTEKMLVESELKEQSKKKGFIGHLKYWFSSIDLVDDEFTTEEKRKVLFFLENSMQHLCTMFNLDDKYYCDLFALEDENVPNDETNISSLSSHDVSGNMDFTSPLKARERSAKIKYMGNPDLQPVKTSESLILVQSLYRLSCKFNNKYGDEILQLWNRQDLWGDLSREVLCAPCTIHNYSKGTLTSTIVSYNLPPRVSLRPLASYSFIFWLLFIGFCFKMFGYGYVYVIILLIFLLLSIICIKVALRKIGLLNVLC